MLKNSQEPVVTVTPKNITHKLTAEQSYLSTNSHRGDVTCCTRRVIRFLSRKGRARDGFHVMALGANDKRFKH